MGKLSARELGFDACMFMLHKTFGAPKAGGGGYGIGVLGAVHLDQLQGFFKTDPYPTGYVLSDTWGVSTATTQ